MRNILAIVAGAALLCLSGISSARAFDVPVAHDCGPQRTWKSNALHICHVPTASSGTTARQPSLTRPTSWTPYPWGDSVRSRLRLSLKLQRISAALGSRQFLESTATSEETLTDSSTSPPPQSQTTKTYSRTYSRSSWQPSSARRNGEENERNPPSVSTAAAVAAPPQPPPITTSSAPSTVSGISPFTGAARFGSVAAAATTEAVKDAVAPEGAPEKASNGDGAMDDTESALKRAKEAFLPFQRKIQDNIADGNFGERGEAWAVAQALIVVGVVTNNIPIVGGLVLLLAGPGLLVGGIAASAAGVTALGESLSPWAAPTKDNILKTDGVFGLVRHPAYSGLIMFCFGLGVTTSSPTRILLAALLAIVLDQKTAREEEMLVDMHGAAYDDYRKSVAKFVPRYY